MNCGINQNKLAGISLMNLTEFPAQFSISLLIAVYFIQFKLKTFSLIDEIGNNRKLINEMELIAGNDKVDLRINELNEK